MEILAGETIYFPFLTRGADLQMVDPDAAPSVVLVQNGADDGAGAVAARSTGSYVASKVLPSGGAAYAEGTKCWLEATATVGGIATKYVSQVYTIVAKRASNIIDANNRVNVGRWLDQAVTLTNNLPDSNAKQYGGNPTGAIPPTLDQLNTSLNLIIIQYNGLAGTIGNLQTSVDDAGELVVDLHQVAHGDRKIDKTNPAQWQHVILLEGTATELLRQNLKDLAGVAISDANPLRDPFVAEVFAP